MACLDHFANVRAARGVRLSLFQWHMLSPIGLSVKRNIKIQSFPQNRGHWFPVVSGKKGRKLEIQRVKRRHDPNRAIPLGLESLGRARITNSVKSHRASL